MLLCCLMYRYIYVLVLYHKLIYSTDWYSRLATSVNYRATKMTDPGATKPNSTSDTSVLSTPSPVVQAITTVKLPAFATLDASSWFRMVEIRFLLWKIKSSQMKADYVLGDISNDLFPQVSV